MEAAATKDGAPPGTPCNSSTELCAVDIAAGSKVTCAVRKDDGAVFCWGRNESILTMSPVVRSPRPMQVPAAPRSAAVALGSGFACSIAYATLAGVPLDGEVWCWGGAGFGRLGTGEGLVDFSPYGPRAVITSAGTLRGALGLALGVNHACAWRKDDVQCWGLGETLQNGQSGNVNVASKVEAFGVSALAASESHTCGVSNGRASCFGSNDQFRLGGDPPNGSPSSAEPVLVSLVDGSVTSIAAHRLGGCALSDRGLYCWGGGHAATRIAEPGMVTRVAALLGRVCVITIDDRVRCGSAVDPGTFVDGPIVPELTKLAVGEDHACALTSGGRVLCWGSNDQGQLGDGTEEARATPVAVTPP